MNTSGPAQAMRPDSSGMAITQLPAMQVPVSLLNDLIAQAPVAIAVFRGRNFVFEQVSEAYLQLIDRSEAQLIGQTLFNALPELAHPKLERLLHQVMDTGIPYAGNEYQTLFTRFGKTQKAYSNFVYQPLRDTDGAITGLMLVMNDVTSLVQSRQVIQQSEQAFRSIVLESPVAMGILHGPEMTIQLANTTLLRLWQRTGSEVMEKPLLRVFPELERQPFMEQLQKVYMTGVSYREESSLLYIDTPLGMSQHYLDFMLAPMREQDGAVSGILVTINDVTAQVSVKQELAANEHYFRRMADNVPAMLFVSSPDGSVTYHNSQWYEYTGQSQEAALGFGWLNAVHPEERGRVETALEKSIRQRLPFKIEFRLYSQFGHYRWFVQGATPRYGANGLIEGYTGAITDIHERKLAEEKLREAEAGIRLAAEGTGIATWDMDLKTSKMLYSPRLNEIFGHGRSAVLSRQQIRGQIHPDDVRELVDPAVSLSLTTGNFTYEVRIFWPDGSQHWVRCEGKLISSDTNVAQRLVGTMADVTVQRNAYAALQENELLFKTIAGIAPVGLWMTNAAGARIFVNETWVNWSGISFEENLTTGWYRCVLEEDLPPVRVKYQEAFAARQYFSAEFRIKRPDGKIRWCHSEGYPYYDINGGYAGYSGSVSDITERKSIEEDLEQRVQERTDALQRANVKLEFTNHELEQYAYVASHDLQEPLRKIRTYSDLLHTRLQDSIPEASLGTLKKVMDSAERMSFLIKDLLNFSRLSNVEQAFEWVDLNAILGNIKSDFELTIEQKGAIISIANLPRIYGSALQMNQLFYNLVNNALKFCAADKQPEVSIASEIVSGAILAAHNLDPQLGYHQITVTDNGIGFGQQYASQIFEVFKRLHAKAAYPGSGIGLALCRKIALNHHGAIYATSEEGAGATFTILLPLQATA